MPYSPPGVRSPLRRGRRALLLLLLPVAAARASAQAVPDARPADTLAAVPGLAADDSTAAAARRAAAVAIAVGDRIRVKVWREPTLSDEFTVDERGDVILPRLGITKVAGRTIAAMQDTLRMRYAEYLRNPSVSVTVFRRVGVQGEVRAPNLYYVDATMTLREVLAQAGGITEIGNPNDVVIVRNGQQVALGRWQRGGPLSAELRSGDQVVVGRRSWLSRNALAVVSTLGLVVSVALSVINSL